jgi:hypothetical protein
MASLDLAACFLVNLTDFFSSEAFLTFSAFSVTKISMWQLDDKYGEILP